jgi:hypothetical protein
MALSPGFCRRGLRNGGGGGRQRRRACGESLRLQYRIGRRLWGQVPASTHGVGLRAAEDDHSGDSPQNELTHDGFPLGPQTRQERA